MRAFMLSPVGVLGQADRGACGLPQSREFVGVVDEEIRGGMRTDLMRMSQMNLGAVKDGKTVPAAFVLMSGKAKPLVMR